MYSWDFLPVVWTVGGFEAKLVSQGSMYFRSLRDDGLGFVDFQYDRRLVFICS